MYISTRMHYYGEFLLIVGQLHEKYVGCFVDTETNRKSETVLGDQDNLTIEICIHTCYTETNQTNSEMTFAALNVSKFEQFLVLTFHGKSPPMQRANLRYCCPNKR